VCYTFALYGLLLFWIGASDLLAPFNPLLKFVIVKTVVFLTFWQARARACSGGAWSGAPQRPRRGAPDGAFAGRAAGSPAGMPAARSLRHVSASALLGPRPAASPLHLPARPSTQPNPEIALPATPTHPPKGHRHIGDQQHGRPERPRGRKGAAGAHSQRLLGAAQARRRMLFSSPGAAGIPAGFGACAAAATLSPISCPPPTPRTHQDPPKPKPRKPPLPPHPRGRRRTPSSASRCCLPAPP
jgi:hypothetical protein